MLQVEVPPYPRGFLFSVRPVEPPPTFVPGPVLPNFWVHPWTHTESAGDLTLFVIIIGHAVPTSPKERSTPAVDLLAALYQGEGVFLRALAEYSGRHAVFFGSAGNIRVVNDATGMRSVFYAAKGGVVASHAQLVEQALDSPVVPSSLPFRYGYPGNRTPFERTKILTPNTYYWVTSNLVRRFWPIVAPALRSVDEAATHLLEASSFALRSIAVDRPVRLTLTAGLDSRAVFAVALTAGVDFETYTYGNDPGSHVDRLAARDLAAHYGVTHTPVEQKLSDPVLQARISESNYLSHHAPWVGALRNYFAEPQSLAVMGNLLEIGRSNYTPARTHGAAAPLTAQAMAALHHRKMGDRVRRQISEYGQDRFFEESVAAFKSFIEDTGMDIITGILDPFDQFYWEHRMGTWQGVAMGERDFYAEAFIPFNARSVFESMLGVPEEQRRQDMTVLRMIELVDPELLDFPVNPRVWPVRKRRAI